MGKWCADLVEDQVVEEAWDLASGEALHLGLMWGGVEVDCPDAGIPVSGQELLMPQHRIQLTMAPGVCPTRHC